MIWIFLYINIRLLPYDYYILFHSFSLSFVLTTFRLLVCHSLRTLWSCYHCCCVL